MRLGFLPGLIAASALAQSTPPRPAFDEFEVATVKPRAPDSPGTNSGRYFRMETAHRFHAINYTLKFLIALGWNLPTSAISGGPSWIDSDHFDIVAEAPGDVRPTIDEQMAMLRKLISERFDVALHREPRTLPIYALTIAKGGPKLKPSTESVDANPQGPPPVVIVISPGDARLPAHNATVADFTAVMQRTVLRRPIVDNTGLSGRFDFELEWTPDDSQFDGPLPKAERPDAKPDLFTAIQEQMGLRLEATRGTVQTIVVDRASKPSDN